MAVVDEIAGHDTFPRPVSSEIPSVSLNADDVRGIAHLARMAIDEDEVEALRQELARVLELVEQLQAVDTTGVEPMAHPLGASLRLREDRVSESDRREVLQGPAPAVEAGYFLVPRVVE